MNTSDCSKAMTSGLASVFQSRFSVILLMALAVHALAVEPDLPPNWRIQTWRGAGGGAIEGNTAVLNGGGGHADQTVFVVHRPRLAIPEHGFYRLSARLRGEDIRNHACVYAAIRTGGMQDVSSRKVSGSFEWQTVEIILNPAEAIAEAAYVSIKLFGPGTLWIQDVVMEPLTEAEANARRQQEAESLRQDRRHRIGRLMKRHPATLPSSKESPVELFRLWGTQRPDYAPVPPGWMEVARPAEPDAWEIASEVNDGADNGYRLFSRPSLEPVGLDTLPRQQDQAFPLSTFLPPGEYGLLTFSVHALQDIDTIRVSISDLLHEDQVIPSSRIDIRTVNFIRVVHDRARKNYFHEPFLLEKGPDFIDKGTTRRYWLTVHVPDEALPGRYEGTIDFTAANVPASRIPVTLQVLPFRLPKHEKVTFVWWDENSQVRQYPVAHEFIDQREHGMSTLLARASRPQRGHAISEQEIMRMADTLEGYLTLHRRLGFRDPLIGGHSNHQIVYHWDRAINWFRMNPRSSETDALFLSVYRRLYIEEAKKRGWPEIMHYVFDEPGGARPELLSDSADYLSLLKATYPQLKTWVTFGGGLAQGYDEIEILGPHLDYWVVNRYDPEIAARFRNHDKEIWVYNGGGGFGRGPRRNRFFYGVYGHKIQADGQGQWIYAFEGTGTPYEQPLVEAPDGNNGFVFRGTDGPIPSTFWATLREGVNDRRYLQLLEHEIGRAERTDDPDRLARATRARETLNQIMDQVSDRYQTGTDIPEAGLTHLDFSRFDRWRWHVALHIMDLQGTRPVMERVVDDEKPAYAYRIEAARSARQGGLVFPVPVGRVATAYRLSAPPTIDGRLDPGEWDGAGALRDFTYAPFVVQGAPRDTPYGAAPAPVGQRAFIGYDDTYLYVAFESPLPDGIRPKAEAMTDDGDVWADDAVEIFIKPGLGPSPYWVFIANSAGRKLDGQQRDTTWKADWTHAATIGDGRWTCEIRIPWAAVHIRPSEGMNLLMNVGRNAVHAGKYASWAVLQNSAHEPDRFGRISLAGHKHHTTPAILRLEHTGLPRQGMAAFTALVHSDTEVETTLEGLASRDGRDVATHTMRARLKTGVNRLAIPLPVQDDGHYEITVRLVNETSTVERKFEYAFSSSAPVRLQVQTPVLLERDPVITCRIEIPDTLPLTQEMMIKIGSDEGATMIAQPVRPPSAAATIQIPLLNRLPPGRYHCRLIATGDDTVLAEQPLTVLPDY